MKEFWSSWSGGMMVGAMVMGILCIIIIAKDDARGVKEFSRLYTEGKYEIQTNITYGKMENKTNYEFVKVKK